MPALLVLFESASGYALLEAVEAGDLAALKGEVQAAVTDLGRFSKMVKLKAFQPFSSAENALANINDVSEGIVNEDLKAFLEAHVPRSKPGKEVKAHVGVIEPKIGTAIQDGLGLPCVSNETVTEIIRGVRAHFAHFVGALAGGGLEKAQLGLAHSYSRAKVKFNVNKSDNMIIQAIALCDQLDKDLNTFAMRVREWYGWHFPELARIVKDNTLYARVAQYIGARSTLSEERLPGLTAITLDEDVSNSVLEASRTSMGMDISEVDLANVAHFTSRLVSLARYRLQLGEYLTSKMDAVAPNLAALIGDSVGARLISHAGSLVNLAKSPASTVQILGAEKALFRALKTKGNTPKYGLIFHSSFIGRAAAKNKGRISRYLANKCAIASRIDSFSETGTRKFGNKLREQVEGRLEFYESGKAPAKNMDVMKAVLAEVQAEMGGAVMSDAAMEGEAAGAKSSKKDKSAKKEGKSEKKAKKEGKSEKKAKKEAAMDEDD